jgi:hypothetical protein
VRWGCVIDGFHHRGTEDTEVGGFFIYGWPDVFDSAPIQSRQTLAPHCRGERAWVRGPILQRLRYRCVAAVLPRRAHRRSVVRNRTSEWGNSPLNPPLLSSPFRKFCHVSRSCFENLSMSGSALLAQHPKPLTLRYSKGECAPGNTLPYLRRHVLRGDPLFLPPC